MHSTHSRVDTLLSHGTLQHAAHVDPPRSQLLLSPYCYEARHEGCDLRLSHCSCNAQDTLQAIIESGALSHLDTDQQWSLRMLLPRRGAFTAKAPAAGAGQAPVVPPAQQQQAVPAVPATGNDQTLALLAAMLTAPAPAHQVSALSNRD